MGLLANRSINHDAIRHDGEVCRCQTVGVVRFAGEARGKITIPYCALVEGPLSYALRRTNTLHGDPRVRALDPFFTQYVLLGNTFEATLQVDFEDLFATGDPEPCVVGPWPVPPACRCFECCSLVEDGDITATAGARTATYNRGDQAVRYTRVALCSRECLNKVLSETREVEQWCQQERNTIQNQLKAARQTHARMKRLIRSLATSPLLMPVSSTSPRSTRTSPP